MAQEKLKGVNRYAPVGKPRKRPGRHAKVRKAHSKKQSFFTEGACR